MVGAIGQGCGSEYMYDSESPRGVINLEAASTRVLAFATPSAPCAVRAGAWNQARTDMTWRQSPYPATPFRRRSEPACQFLRPGPLARGRNPDARSLPASMPILS